jgi:hypothetical protein
MMIVLNLQCDLRKDEKELLRPESLNGGIFKVGVLTSSCLIPLENP